MNGAYGKRSSIFNMRTKSTSGASIADSEMNSTLDLDSRRMAGETYSTAQCGSIVVCARIESMRAIFSTGWLYLCNGITSAKETREVRPTTLVERALVKTTTSMI